MGRTGFDMGAELNPLPIPAWLGGLSINVIMVSIALVYGLQNRRKDIVTLAFSLAAAGFCILTIRSGRFVEYFVPFSAAAIALASRYISWRFFSHVILGVSVVFTLWIGIDFLSGLSERPNDMPSDVASFLQQQIPKGSQVFTTDWSHTGLLMLTLPERRFMVALDPTLFFVKNPDLYRLWYRICHEAPVGSADIIRRRFGARYVLAFNAQENSDLFYQLVKDQSVQKLLYSKTWLLFDLGDHPDLGQTLPEKSPISE
jgi:hypothetical protein